MLIYLQKYFHDVCWKRFFQFYFSKCPPLLSETSNSSNMLKRQAFLKNIAARIPEAPDSLLYKLRRGGGICGGSTIRLSASNPLGDPLGDGNSSSESKEQKECVFFKNILQHLRSNCKYHFGWCKPLKGRWPTNVYTTDSGRTDFTQCLGWKPSRLQNLWSACCSKAKHDGSCMEVTPIMFERWSTRGTAKWRKHCNIVPHVLHPKHAKAKANAAFECRWITKKTLWLIVP